MRKPAILIADDDPGMRLLLTGIVEKSGAFSLCGVGEDGTQLLALYERERPQAVIMDVEMPGMTGIECARLIQDRDPRCIIIFVTAHEQYMGDAFQLYAFDYMVKPFPVERALTTLHRAAQRIEEMETRSAKEEAPARLPRRVVSGSRLMLRGKEGISFVDMDEILLVQREDRQTKLCCMGGKTFVTSDTMGEIEEKLPADVFFRAHKSYIVNVNHIETITPYGRWTYIVRLSGTQQDALITAERFEELKEAFS